MKKIVTNSFERVKNPTYGLGKSKSIETENISITLTDVHEKNSMNTFLDEMIKLEPEFSILPNEESQDLEENMSNMNQLEIGTGNITADKFSEYRRCQKLGKFNMLDYSNWESHTFLTEREWYQIISNYDSFKQNFEVKNA